MHSFRKQFPCRYCIWVISWWKFCDSTLLLSPHTSRKACTLTDKNLCRHRGIRSSICDLSTPSCTLSFATLPLGNNSHAILWMIQELPYWLRAASVLHVNRRKNSYFQNNVISSWTFSSIKSEFLWNTFHHSRGLLCTEQKKHYLMPRHAIFAQLFIFY